MKRLILELRRREVFRTAGLYVGIAWIVVEVSSVVLPTFDAPDWALKAIIICAVAGFPVMLVLTWIYDITEHGIVVQQDATDTQVVPFGGRRTDFVVIGVLSVALIFSVYMNMTSGPAVQEAPPLISVLIADFDNQTGNELFNGTLEQALLLGIEGASFITSYSRANALQQAQSLDLGQKLDESVARLVSVRQDVKMVLAGSIVPDGSKLRLEVHAVDPAAGTVVAQAETQANSAADVLGAINSLSASIREDLGDTGGNLEQLRAESVTANSLEALKFYTTAQDLARAGQDEEAIGFYEKAVQSDPEMARAYSGWGLSAFKIGRRSESEEQWKKALSLLDRMTERERYRTLGLYYTVVSLNYDSAIENYQQLVQKYPADGAGYNNLAVLYTFTAQYTKALETSKLLLTVYPNTTLYHANHAQYAIYAGDMTLAASEARKVIADDPAFFKAYMSLAMVSLYEGSVDDAIASYRRMAESGARGSSLASIGLADIALFQGRNDDAIVQLREAIEADLSAGNERGIAAKNIALAQALIAAGDSAAGLQLLTDQTEARGDGQLVPAAEMLAANAKYEAAFRIAEQYRTQLSPTARAYANLIDGISAYHQGEAIIAISAFKTALEFADLWIVRFYLGQAYLSAGYPAEAGAEFDLLYARRSEAAGLFFDDIPTWRYTASLGEWQAKANKALADSLSASAVR